MRLRLLPLLALVACADPVDINDAGPKDAGLDASIVRDAGLEEDTGVLGDTGTVEDASTIEDTGVEPDAGVVLCDPTGRQYFMLGSAQNPQTVTFGAGLPSERTVQIDGSYLASFDSGGCFEWVALMPSQQSSFGGTNMIVDAAGNIYFALALNGNIEFRNADNTIALTVSSTAGPPAQALRRGAAVVSYDKQGRLRWFKRFGNAMTEPAAKGYSVTSLELTNGHLRVAGSVNGATRDIQEDYEMVFGLGETEETRVVIGKRYQFGYVAALALDTGELIADSVGISAPQIGATNHAIRHNGRGTATEASDGSFGLGMLIVGAAGNYLLNWGEPSETNVSVSNNFIALFSKYDASGSLSWYQFGGFASGGMSIFSSGMMADGAQLFSGGAADGADFGDGKAVRTMAAGATGYLLRYDALGNLAWLRGISGRGLSKILVDETRGALFVLGAGDGDVTFGVGDADAVTESLAGPFVARFDLTDGALVWLAPVDADSAAFTDLDLVGDELLLSTRFDNRATFAAGTADEVTAGQTLQIWSGHARYGADDGGFHGLLEYVSHRGTQLNDGLNVGSVFEP